MKFKHIALAAAALLAPAAANATTVVEHISGTGFFDAGTLTTAYSKAAQSFTFFFDVTSDATGSFSASDAITNASYNLNGNFTTAPVHAEFFTAAQGGGFDLDFDNGTKIGYYAVPVLSSAGKFVADGFYDGTVAVNDVETGNGGFNLTMFATAVPETATWAMMIIGVGAIGGMMRRGYRKSEEKFTAKVRGVAAA